MLLAMLFGVYSVLPNAAHAESERVPQGFCSRLPQLSDRARSDVDEQLLKIQEQKKERLDRASDERLTKGSRIEENRSQWEVNRAHQYDALFALAKTSQQKEAVRQFQKTMEQLVRARQDALDHAQDVFRTETDKLIASRKVSAERAVTTFKDSFEDASFRARTDCADSKDPSLVREEYRDRVEGARKKLQDDRKAIEKVRISLEPLVATRAQAIQDAMNAFTVGAEQARDDLKAAFR